MEEKKAEVRRHLDGWRKKSRGIPYSHHDFVDMLLIIHKDKHKIGSISIHLGKKIQ